MPRTEAPHRCCPVSHSRHADRNWRDQGNLEDVPEPGAARLAEGARRLPDAGAAHRDRGERHSGMRGNKE